MPAKCFAQSVVANHIYTIHGMVKDSLFNPLSSATVSCVRLKDSAVATQLTGANGTYLFAQKNAGSYIIIASHEGYLVCKSKPFVIDSIGSKNITIPDIILQEDVKLLKDVTVTAASKKLFEASSGKLIMNVEQSAAASGNSAFELLQRAPGVTVDQNDYILLKGSSNVNVMIDGKMTYLSAQQLNNTLKSMPAENISKIEVINNPGAQYDAAGNTGIINIITKKTNKLGYAANVNAGIGFGHYVLNTENITGNIRTKRFNVFGSFDYDLRHNYKINHTLEASTNNNAATYYNFNSTTIVKSKYYNYKTGADFNLGNKQQLGFVIGGSFDDWSRLIFGQTVLSDDVKQMFSSVVDSTASTEPYYNNTYNINYQFKPDTTGTIITADANYIFYSNNSDGHISNQQFNKYVDSSQPYQNLLYHQPSNINIRSIKADIELPLAKFKLKAGLKYSSVNIDNNFRYDSLIDKAYKYAPALSDHFVYTEKVEAAYISAARQWKHANIDAGLRSETTISDGNSISSAIYTKRTYTNLFPTISYEQQLDDNNKISLAVSRRINRPGYFGLNPVRFYSSKYSYYQGNPYLKPEFSWQTSLSYTWKDKYIATLSYNRVKNYISLSGSIDTAGVYVLNNINYAYAGLFDLTVIVPVTLFSFWNINTITDVYCRYYPVPDGAHIITAKKASADITLNQTFSISNWGVFELNAHYRSPGIYGYYLTKFDLSVDGGFKKSLIKTRLDLKCAFTDLFHTYSSRGYSFISTINYSYITIRDSRRLRLSLTYHFGGKLSGGKLHSIEEENRL